MSRFTLYRVAVMITLISMVGCGRSPNATVRNPQREVVDASRFLLASEPAGARGVGELREESNDQDDVVMIGRIGGADKPWVEGRAAFVVVDPSVELCDEAGDGVCACCQDKVCDATALVKFVDQNGHLLKSDARDLLNVSGNELVVVSGKAKRDDAGNRPSWPAVFTSETDGTA